MMQWIKKLVICMCCFCMMGLPINVMASKKVGTQTDVDELRHETDDYADVIFKGKINGESDQKYFYITAVNLKTAESFSFQFSTRNKLVAKGKLPMGDYQIQEGGVANDWTGEYAPDNVKFSVNDRSVAKVVNVTFGATRNASESREDREKIYQTQQGTTQKEVTQNSSQTNKSNTIQKTNRSSDRNFYIFFVIGMIACGGLIGFIIRFIKKFR